MSRYKPRRTSDLGQGLKKFLLSGFVVFTFIAYVIHERLTNPDANLASVLPTPSLTVLQSTSVPLATAPLPGSDASVASNPLPTNPPLVLPPTTPLIQSGYKDGTFKGPEVDAYYGLVQVQATIQSGKLANVQFLEFPSDRRTSQEINNIAVPYLQQEALQAQSARVDIISGATLTSEAFMMSLQNALDSAKN
jgi:uncharacterized protein with FMN-binding domain